MSAVSPSSRAASADERLRALDVVIAVLVVAGVLLALPSPVWELAATVVALLPLG